MDSKMETFLALDKVIRDAFVSQDHLKLLRVAGALALYADERTLKMTLNSIKEEQAA